MSAVSDWVTGPWDPPEPAPPEPPDTRAPWRVVVAVVVGLIGPLLLARSQFGMGSRAMGAVVLIGCTAAAVLRLGRNRWWGSVLLVGVPLVALPALRSQLVVGLTASAVAYAAVVVAFAVISEWEPHPRWPRRRTPLVGLALPFLAFAEIRWAHDHLAAPIVLVSLAVALAVTVAYQLRSEGAARWDHRLAHGIRVGVDVVGLVAFLVVAIPLLYLPGAVVRLVRTVARRLRARPASMWSDYGVERADEQRDAAWLFASTPRPTRLRRSVAGIVVIALVVGVSWTVIERRRDAIRPPGPALGAPAPSGRSGDGPSGPAPAGDQRFIIALENMAKYEDLPSMRGVPWAAELQASELRMNDSGNLTSRYVNSQGRVRRSIAPPDCDCRTLDVWILGGSAAWGQGQRDDHTIASELVRLAEDDGISMDITNLGSRGATTRGSIPTLDEHLQEHDAPDLVLFYTGYNDVQTNVISDYVHGPRDDWASMDFDDLAVVNGQADRFLAWDGGADAGRRAAKRMREDRATVRSLGEQYGFGTVFIFQPDVLVSTTQLEGYEEITGVSAEEMLRSPLAEGLAAAAADLDDVAIDLRGMFADAPEPVFIGLVHQNEAGARAVAEEIDRRLGKVMRSRSHPS